MLPRQARQRQAGRANGSSCTPPGSKAPIAQPSSAAALQPALPVATRHRVFPVVGAEQASPPPEARREQGEQREQLEPAEDHLEAHDDLGPAAELAEAAERADVEPDDGDADADR